MKIVAILASIGLVNFVTPSVIPHSSHPYCDQWNSHSSNSHQCVNKKCVPLKCSANQDCADGFNCEETLCIPLKNVQDNGRYCDEWTPCSSQNQCIKKRCVPLKCYKDTNCVSDFSCFNNECVSNSYTGVAQGYCDGSTPCSKKNQCVNKKCVPLGCKRTPDCAQGYRCNEGNCIQISNSHGAGRYCDAENQCDTLHKCEDKICIWK